MNMSAVKDNQELSNQELMKIFGGNTKDLQMIKTLLSTAQPNTSFSKN